MQLFSGVKILYAMLHNHFSLALRSQYSSVQVLDIDALSWILVKRNQIDRNWQ